MTKCYVYIVRVHDTHFKIGVASYIKRRLSGLQTGCPYPISLVHTFQFESSKDAYIVERFLHQEHDGFLNTGEWYNLSQLQIERIKNIDSNKILDIAKNFLRPKPKKKYVSKEYPFTMRFISDERQWLDEICKAYNLKSYAEVIRKLAKSEYENLQVRDSVHHGPSETHPQP